MMSMSRCPLEPAQHHTQGVFPVRFDRALLKLREPRGRDANPLGCFAKTEPEREPSPEQSSSGRAIVARDPILGDHAIAERPIHAPTDWSSLNPKTPRKTRFIIRPHVAHLFSFVR